MIRGGAIFRAPTHPDGYRDWAEYDIRGSEIFRTVMHHDGYRGHPDYDIRQCDDTNVNQ